MGKRHRMSESGGKNSKLILAAMIFAVSMTFIDQTIVAIAIPTIQQDLSLSSTGVQWIINGYLLSLSALFAFGGRLADIAGHRRMVVIGVVVFAVASALCGATPTGARAEAWLIVFRVDPGRRRGADVPGGAGDRPRGLPAAERGRALAIFFGIAGGLTSIGPIAGGYLTEWTWRAIFWVNIPVAIIALILTAKAKPDDEQAPGAARLPRHRADLRRHGPGRAGPAAVERLGLGRREDLVCIAAGLALIGAFVVYRAARRQPAAADPDLREPRLRGRQRRPLPPDDRLRAAVLLRQHVRADLARRKRLGNRPLPADLLRRLRHRLAVGRQNARQRRGRRPVVLGCAVAAVGFFLWGTALTDLSVSDQWNYIVIAGAGVGLVLSPANTDALNRVPSSRYGEATGITQTVRNFGSSLGLAVLGTILILENKSNLEASLGAKGVPKATADQVADCVSQGGAPAAKALAQQAGTGAAKLFSTVPHDFALASRTVFYGMAVVMAVAFVVALAAMPGGKVEEQVDGGPGRAGLAGAA